MEKSGNMYFLASNEYIKAKKLGPRIRPFVDVYVHGPCIVRVENSAKEPGIGNVLSVQIGFGRGREYLVAGKFEGVVFQDEA